ncbi:MAG: hypothetical protein KGJ06_07385 [Pseudomonadota bacterium]|nr:hypothetical protein [Pseudomonadota bacterium]
MRSLPLAAAFCALASPALALDGKVYSPQIVKGEAEIEYAGTRTFDASRDKNDLQGNQFSLGYAFTDYWMPEFYFAEFARGPGQPQYFTGNEFENLFQFWPTGKYWLDAGLLASYRLAAKKDDADSVELKLLLQKDIGRFTALANMGVERQIGSRAIGGNDLASAANIRYRWSEYLQPGVEWQADYGALGDRLPFGRQEHYLGPIMYGRLAPGLRYEAGYFAGVSSAAASSAMRLRLEYEMFF